MTRPTSPAPGVPSYDLFDLMFADNFNTINVRGGINNALDKDPPIVAGTIGQTPPGT